MLLPHSAFGRVAQWGAHRPESKEQFSPEEPQATGIGDIRTRGSA